MKKFDPEKPYKDSFIVCEPICNYFVLREVVHILSELIEAVIPPLYRSQITWNMKLLGEEEGRSKITWIYAP